MKIRFYQNNYSKQYEIYPFDLNDITSLTKITVFKQRTYEDIWQDSEINWPAIGSVSPAKTEIFNNGLTRAIKIARELNTGITPEITEEEIIK